MSIIDDIHAGPYAFPWLAASSFEGKFSPGMELRDYFATQAPQAEVQELMFRHLSLLAQERLTGLPYPRAPEPNHNDVDFQLAEFDFKCAVIAAIRLRLADAMLKARES